MAFALWHYKQTDIHQLITFGHLLMKETTTIMKPLSTPTIEGMDRRIIKKIKPAKIWFMISLDS